MTGRPLIGVTGRRKRGDQLVGNIAILADFAVDVFYADYGRGVLEAGGVPVFLPLDVDPVDFMDHLDGVLFLDRMTSMESLTYMEEYSRFHAKDDD